MAAQVQPYNAIRQYHVRAGVKADGLPSQSPGRCAGCASWIRAHDKDHALSRQLQDGTAVLRPVKAQEAPHSHLATQKHLQDERWQLKAMVPSPVRPCNDSRWEEPTGKALRRGSQHQLLQLGILKPFIPFHHIKMIVQALYNIHAKGSKVLVVLNQEI